MATSYYYMTVRLLARPRQSEGSFRVVEQLNIEGKRSGDGFVANRQGLIASLLRATADRVQIIKLTVGRKGLLTFLKALSGNVIKIVPTAKGFLKVVCGQSVSQLEDSQWLKDNDAMTFVKVKCQSKVAVVPNVGVAEIAGAISRVIPFVSKSEDRPVLSCVLIQAVKGKLTLIASDSYRMAIQTLDIADTEGKALVNGAELRLLVSALRKANRVRLSFKPNPERVTDTADLIIETDAITYELTSYAGEYPDYKKTIPSDLDKSVSFDASDAIKACMTFKAIGTDDKGAYPIDLTLAEDSVKLSNPDGIGEAILPAQVNGDGVTVRIDGAYLSQCLRACGGMVTASLKDAVSPVIFSADGYQQLVMPMLKPTTSEAEGEAEGEADNTADTDAELEAKIAEAEQEADTEPEQEAEPEPEQEAEPEKELVASGSGNKSRRNKK
jgi:DNA polymerase-3 subunit beta